jgi:hypothetical protein
MLVSLVSRFTGPAWPDDTRPPGLDRARDTAFR